MKKYILLAIPLLLLGGCKKANLTIISPTGAPAYAFYKEANNSNFETNADPKNIVAMMTDAGGKDLVVIDTTSGVKAIANGAPYKLAASLTFGNFFIASTGNDNNETMDPGDKIVLFNEKGTPDLLFHYLYGNTYDADIEYVTNVQDAAKCLISKKNAATGNDIKYVFIAQPVLTNALAKNTSAKVYANIQDAYKEKSGGKSLIQASLFVKDKANKNTVKSYLKNLEKNVNDVIANPDLITEAFQGLDAEAISTKYGVATELAVNVLKNNNGLGLGYKSGLENKDNIDAFLKEVQGLNETSEEIYFK